MTRLEEGVAVARSVKCCCKLYTDTQQDPVSLTMDITYILEFRSSTAIEL